MAKGIEIDDSLKCLVGKSICDLYSQFDSLKEGHKVGFTDVDQELPGGHSPRMEMCSVLHIDLTGCDREKIAWLISRGADPFKKIPGSNKKAIHLVNAKFGQSIFCNMRLEHHGPHSYHCYYLTLFRQIEHCIFSTTIKDECFCLCSVCGCTTLSVAIRDVLDCSVVYGRALGPDDDIAVPVSKAFLIPH
jgi:hypothetical protein